MSVGRQQCPELPFSKIFRLSGEAVTPSELPTRSDELAKPCQSPNYISAFDCRLTDAQQAAEMISNLRHVVGSILMQQSRTHASQCKLHPGSRISIERRVILKAGETLGEKAGSHAVGCLCTSSSISAPLWKKGFEVESWPAPVLEAY